MEQVAHILILVAIGTILNVIFTMIKNKGKIDSKKRITFQLLVSALTIASCYAFLYIV